MSGLTILLGLDRQDVKEHLRTRPIEGRVVTATVGNHDALRGFRADRVVLTDRLADHPVLRLITTAEVCRLPMRVPA